jgi:LacI family transcriptional regulator
VFRLATTIRDVAKLAGVSVATVSRVINNLDGVKPQTEQKILKAMKELNYIPNLLARSVVSQRSQLLSMIIPDIENPFFAAVYKGASKKLLKGNYMTLLGDSGDELTIEEQLLKIMLEHRVAGLILTPVSEEPDWLERITLDIPVCLVDRNINHFDCDRVLIDNQLGTYEATKLLINNGHTKIGIISGPLESTPGKERFTGYYRCLKDHNIDIEDDFIQYGDFREKSGYNLGVKLLELESPPTAILSSNNLMTIGLLEAINGKRLTIGRDIAVVGFDDIPIATLMNPKLTVVSRPMQEMGEIAAEMLLKRMENPEEPKQLVRMTPHLIVRGSESIKQTV